MTPGPAGGFASTGISNIDPRSINLDKVQRDFEEALDRLLGSYRTITDRQREQIVDQVRAAVTSNDVAALARLSVSTTAAEEALVEAMTEMSLQAARRVTEEARDQGVKIDPVATDTAPFAATAAALAVLLAQGLTNSAGREALRRWSPTVSGDDVSAAVDEHLASLSDSFLEAHLGNALSAAENAGRVETMMAFPDVALYAAETLDARTCLPCSKVDGRWIGNTQDPDIGAKIAALYPNGGYVDCEGGPRCRGQIVAIWRPERVPITEARLRNHPGHPDQKSHGRKGGSIHDALDGDAAAKDAAMRAAYEGKYGKFTTRVTRTGGGPGEMFAEGTIHDSRGREVGRFDRKIIREEDGTVYAMHNTMELDRRMQGSGFAAEFNGRAVDYYRESGVDAVSLSATDVGGYAWARQGFDFAGPSSAQTMFGELERQVTALRAGQDRNEYGEKISKKIRTAPDLDAQLSAAESLIARARSSKWGEPDYPSAYEMSQVGRSNQTGKGGTWLGKDTMLGTAWEGVMWL